MPKASGRVDEVEKAISGRLALFRKSIRWAQADMAQVLGISIDRYASVEYGRTPMSLGFAAAVCSLLDVNEHWLATGDGLMSPTRHSFSKLDLSDEQKHLFSEYARSLTPASGSNRVLAANSRDDAADVPLPVDASEFLFRRVLEWFGQDSPLSQEDKRSMAVRLGKIGDDLLSEMYRTRLKEQIRRVEPVTSQNRQVGPTVPLKKSEK